MFYIISITRFAVVLRDTRWDSSDRGTHLIRGLISPGDSSHPGTHLNKWINVKCSVINIFRIPNTSFLYHFDHPFCRRVT